MQPWLKSERRAHNQEQKTSSRCQKKARLFPEQLAVFLKGFKFRRTAAAVQIIRPCMGRELSSFVTSKFVFYRRLTPKLYMLEIIIQHISNQHRADPGFVRKKTRQGSAYRRFQTGRREYTNTKRIHPKHFWVN